RTGAGPAGGCGWSAARPARRRCPTAGPRCRRRCRCRSRRWLPQHVADSADGVDQPGLTARLRLATQVADVDLERVAGRREVVTPHVLQDATPGQDLLRVG